ncbi:uncharacterized protein EI90DRAFT_3239563 [Cantharellus anzutake]|uniref:uncharacterized protein n=1 Tax=Cantharellus anzutake TaxID=1750568 RepID=UPI0019062824|nr:uncharacterized protein EI90DRAFT_3239563 [Cantharellus anzutake]KAF8324854.1 hypothetical protein EI90DRAFT_3239563 [Cantharellus anzutake]
MPPVRPNVVRSLLVLAYAIWLASAQYTATYLPWNTPKQSEKGQYGTNQCGQTAHQDSRCQNVFINSGQDFCLWGPPSPGPDSTVGDTESIEVSWCTKDGYGTRLIPPGTLYSVHFVQTPDYVQVTGVGDFTKMNIPKGDEGGELDPHGATGEGNPIGGLVFSNAFGSYHQIHEWTNFMSDNEYCIRGCKDGNTTRAKQLCGHIYDLMGCRWNMPANYNPGIFENCMGDTGLPMGIYGTSTFHQGSSLTPSPHPAPKSSKCVPIGSIGSGPAVSHQTPSHPAATTKALLRTSSSRSSSVRASTSKRSSSRLSPSHPRETLITSIGRHMFPLMTDLSATPHPSAHPTTSVTSEPMSDTFTSVVVSGSSILSTTSATRTGGSQPLAKISTIWALLPPLLTILVDI